MSIVNWYLLPHLLQSRGTDGDAGQGRLVRVADLSMSELAGNWGDTLHTNTFWWEYEPVSTDELTTLVLDFCKVKVRENFFIVFEVKTVSMVIFFLGFVEHSMAILSISSSWRTMVKLQVDFLFPLDTFTASNLKDWKGKHWERDQERLFGGSRSQRAGLEQRRSSRLTTNTFTFTIIRHKENQTLLWRRETINVVRNEPTRPVP